MLQRIQSVYLLLATLSGVALFFLPLALINPINAQYEICVLKSNLPGFEILRTNYELMITNSLAIILSFATIFLYKNRKLQIKLSMISFALYSILTIFMIYIIPDFIFTKLAKDVQISYKVAAFFPLISVLCCILASKAIKKDEKLVRSADRLR